MMNWWVDFIVVSRVTEISTMLPKGGIHHQEIILVSHSGYDTTINITDYVWHQSSFRRGWNYCNSWRNDYNHGHTSSEWNLWIPCTKPANILLWSDIEYQPRFQQDRHWWYHIYYLDNTIRLSTWTNNNQCNIPWKWISVFSSLLSMDNTACVGLHEYRNQPNTRLTSSRGYSFSHNSSDQ